MDGAAIEGPAGGAYCKGGCQVGLGLLQGAAQIEGPGMEGLPAAPAARAAARSHAWLCMCASVALHVCCELAGVHAGTVRSLQCLPVGAGRACSGTGRARSALCSSPTTARSGCVHHARHAPLACYVLPPCVHHADSSGEHPVCLQAIADTGTSLLVGPPEVIDDINAVSLMMVGWLVG